MHQSAARLYKTVKVVQHPAPLDTILYLVSYRSQNGNNACFAPVFNHLACHNSLLLRMYNPKLTVLCWHKFTVKSDSEVCFSALHSSNDPNIQNLRNAIYNRTPLPNTQFKLMLKCTIWYRMGYLPHMVPTWLRRAILKHFLFSSSVYMCTTVPTKATKIANTVILYY